MSEFAMFNARFMPSICFFYPEMRRLGLGQIDLQFIWEKLKLHWEPLLGAVNGRGQRRKGEGGKHRAL